MNIYLGNETDFNNNGLGFLTDTISAMVHDELNGNYELTLEYVLNGHLAEYLEKENIIRCEVADGTKQLFRITNVSKNFKTIQVTAKHVFYDLLNNFLEDVYPQNLNGLNFLNYILHNTEFQTNFFGISDITDLKTARYVRMNPVQAIMGDVDNSMIKLFGGELKRSNFIVYFLSRVGQDNGVKLIIGKNITGINVSVDITEMATRVMPVGYDGLMLPEKYVDSPLINNYPTPKVIKLEFSDVKIDENTTEQQAYAELRRLVNEQYSLGLDKPKINININWVELSKTEEYKQYASLETVRLGDTITAQILGMNYETRVIAIDYNVLKGMITNFQIGTFTPTIASSMNSLRQKVDEINPSSILAEATQNATELITSAMGGYVYKTQNELYIMDSNDPQQAQKVWRWNINGLGYSSTGINGPYGLAMTMDGSIVADFITTGTLNTNLIKGYDSLTIQVQDNTDTIGDRSGKTTTIAQDISSIQAQISEIADITTSSSTETALISDTELQNVANSFPIRLEIHPINENISYLYPSQTTYPSLTTYLKIRKIRFTNTSTNEVFECTLPQDLLYYDDTTYDEFVADYETSRVTVTKRCKYNSDGTVGVLDTPVITEYDYEEFSHCFSLTEGNYQISLPGYTQGYIFARLMVLNAYTAQYATKIELSSAITQTSTSIMSEVSQSYETKTDATTKTNQLSTRISQTVRSISLTANDNGTSCGLTIKLKNEDGTELSTNQANITLSGLVKFTDLSGSGTTTINGSNITTGIIKSSNYVSGTSGTSINLSTGEITTKNFQLNSSGTVTATNATITGIIRATSGYIGSSSSGWNISSAYLYRGGTGGTNGARLYADGRLYMKNNYGWINSGTGGTLINGNGSSYPVIISDQVGKDTRTSSYATIELSAMYGDLRLATDVDLVLSCRSGSLIIDGYTGQSIDRIIYKDSQGENKYMIFYKGILVGYN